MSIINFGFIEYSSIIQVISNPLGDKDTSPGRIIIQLIMLTYAIIALNILKLRYVYLTLTSSKIISKEKYPILMHWINTCYTNTDLLVFMILSTISNMQDFGYYTQINQDCTNFLLFFGVFLAMEDPTNPDFIKFDQSKLFKHSQLGLLFYVQILMIAIYYDKWYTGVGLLPLFLLALLIDFKNITIMTTAYKLMGYKNQDPSVNMEGVYRQRRRRYSIVYLKSNSLIDKNNVKINLHVDRWMKKCQEKDKEIYRNPRDYIRRLRRFVEAVWIVIYAIRQVSIDYSIKRTKAVEQMDRNVMGINSNKSYKKSGCNQDDSDSMGYLSSQEISQKDKEMQENIGDDELSCNNPNVHNSNCNLSNNDGANVIHQEKSMENDNDKSLDRLARKIYNKVIANADANLIKDSENSSSRNSFKKDSCKQGSPAESLKDVSKNQNQLEPQSNFKRSFGNLPVVYEGQNSSEPGSLNPFTKAINKSKFENSEQAKRESTFGNQGFLNYKTTQRDETELNGLPLLSSARSFFRTKTMGSKPTTIRTDNSPNLQKFPIGRLDRFIYIVFFPITMLFYFIIPVYRVKKIYNKEKIYLMYVLVMILKFLLILFIFYAENVLIVKWSLKTYIVALQNAIFFNISNFIYTKRRIIKKDKETRTVNIYYNGQDSSKSKLGLFIGVCWFLGLIMDNKPVFNNKTVVQLSILYMIAFIFILYVYNICFKFELKRCLGYLFCMLFFVFTFLLLMF